MKSRFFDGIIYGSVGFCWLLKSKFIDGIIIKRIIIILWIGGLVDRWSVDWWIGGVWTDGLVDYYSGLMDRCNVDRWWVNW